MKNILLFFLLSFYNVSFAQNHDAIPENKVKVNNTIALGYTVEQVNAILGEPLEIRDYYSEIDDEIWKEYNYSGNFFYFLDGRLIEFDLVNDKLFLYDNLIRVGTNISSIANFFPKSYLQKGFSDGNGYLEINILLSDNNISDQYILVLFSPVTNIITSIGTASY